MMAVGFGVISILILVVMTFVIGMIFVRIIQNSGKKKNQYTHYNYNPYTMNNSFQQDLRCPYCQSVIQQHFQFCPQCGMSLKKNTNPQ